MRISYLYRQTILGSLIFVFVASSSLTVSASGISMISINQLNLILGNPDIAVIDVRASKDWQSSNVKIKGAVRGVPKNFESWANDFSKDKVLILYELIDPSQELVAVGFPAFGDDIGVRGAEDDVGHVGVFGHHGGHGFDGVLDSLARPEQSEREQQLASLDTEAPLEHVGIAPRRVGNTVADADDLLVGHVIDIAKELASLFRHRDDAIGEPCDFLKDQPLFLEGLFEDRVKRGDQRHPKPPQHRENVAAERTPENPVLVLQADGGHLVGVQELGGQPVVFPLIVADLESDAWRVGVSCELVVHRDGKDIRIVRCLSGDGFAEIVGERGDSTFSREVVSHKRDG